MDKIHSLDLTGAQAFMVTGAADSTPTARLNYKSKTYTAAVDNAVDMDPNSLYKVTADGTLVRVGVPDEKGECR